MFVSGSDKSLKQDNLEKTPFWQKENFTKIAIIILVIIFVLTGGFLAWKYFSKKPIIIKPNINPQEVGNLPDVILNKTKEEKDKADFAKNEALTYGSFYKLYNDNIESKAKPIIFPINIKEKIANYYPFTRQIFLNDETVKQLNEEGYAVIDNPFVKTANNFTSVYSELNKKEIPFLVTNDFLIYYQQNYLKNIYKTIEADIFYKSFWEINLALFKQADVNYLNRNKKIGLANDPVVEGLRLEALYFAMNLELLKPRLNQITRLNTKDNLTRFSQAEASEYQFSAPDYLLETIDKEKKLIEKNRGAGLAKSPIFIYEKSYDDFNIPAEYSKNERLINFYLASVWTRSLFPLYYKDDDCKNCLLDKSDWLINQTAAHLIARDINTNQEIKNKWAKVYKAISYFNSLSSELTYLDYNSSFIQLFKDKKVEDVFANDNKNREQDLLSLRNLISGISFDPAKGGLNRQVAVDRAESGLRILQKKYDPSYFVYNKLISPQVGNFIDYNEKINYINFSTGCVLDNGQVIRCRGMALDLINPIFDETINNDYFKLNTNYVNYFNEVPYLRNHFNKFTVNDWHDNIYWSSLDMSRQYLNSRKQKNFSYSNTNNWANQALNSAVGAVVNSQLPPDIWQYGYKISDNSVKAVDSIEYNFVEPNLRLISELQANSEMVFTMFSQLGIVSADNNAFLELIGDLKTTKEVIKKEISGVNLAGDDWKKINEVVSRFVVLNNVNKVWQLKFNDNSIGNISGIEQSLNGVKLLIEIQHQQDKDILVAGPVFQFKENSK